MVALLFASSICSVIVVPFHLKRLTSTLRSVCTYFFAQSIEKLTHHHRLAPWTASLSLVAASVSLGTTLTRRGCERHSIVTLLMISSSAWRTSWSLVLLQRCNKLVIHPSLFPLLDRRWSSEPHSYRIMIALKSCFWYRLERELKEIVFLIGCC